MSKKQKRVVIKTSQSDLEIVQMIDETDDKEYFDFQNQNREHFKRFGNKVYDTLEEVTKTRIERGDHRFGIRKQGGLIGMEGFAVSGDGKRAELGILLGESSTGHGYATAALKALSDYAIGYYPVVYADVEPNNAKSIALLERVGYVQTEGPVQRDWGTALVFEYKK